MQSYGPNLSETYTNSTALVKFMDQCTKYVSSLTNFEKYCVWRYTIGSASINSFLILNKLSTNAPQWAYVFFKYYKNTFGPVGIPASLKSFKSYVENPELIKKSPGDVQKLIEVYIKIMLKIIKNAPRTPGSFHVFKVASPYPGLPETNAQVPTSVLQLPFNSTTVSPYFNFAPFLSPNSLCCLFDIEIPKGSMCLFIPQEYHAYPFELEIILPAGCAFNIQKIRKATLNYVDPASVAMKQVQKTDNIQMGAVYQINDYSPCGLRNCRIDKKSFTVYDTVYVNP